MIFFDEYDTVDPLGEKVLLLDKSKLRKLRDTSRLRIEDRTSNYIRYREDRTGRKYGFFKNQGE